MIFPKVDQLPRHPSQLYEAGLEGVILFLVLYFFARQEKVRLKLGMLSGIFLIGYAIARMIGEQFREPEVTLPNDITTWGQWLSVPMLLYGIYLVWRAKPIAPRPAAKANAAKADATGRAAKP
jgi:phosphatidylglycerol:prolipoprotein diacylglycerol transferase